MSEWATLLFPSPRVWAGEKNMRGTLCENKTRRSLKACRINFSGRGCVGRARQIEKLGLRLWSRSTPPYAQRSLSWRYRGREWRRVEWNWKNFHIQIAADLWASLCMYTHTSIRPSCSTLKRNSAAWKTSAAHRGKGTNNGLGLQTLNANHKGTDNNYLCFRRNCMFNSH